MTRRIKPVTLYRVRFSHHVSKVFIATTEREARYKALVFLSQYQPNEKILSVEQVNIEDYFAIPF